MNTDTVTIDGSTRSRHYAISRNQNVLNIPKKRIENKLGFFVCIKMINVENKS